MCPPLDRPVLDRSRSRYVAIEIPLASLIGKYKLSQNRSLADRQGVAALLQAGGAEAQDLAAWMQQPPGADA